MAKAKDWPLVEGAVARSKGSLNTIRTKFGTYYQAWPKKRGKAKQGYDLYKQAEFGLAAKWAVTPEPIMYQTAIELAKGTDLVPRDYLMRASYGTYYRIFKEDGTEAEYYRMVAPNAQLILDQVTDTVGAMLYRAPIGWIQVPPGNNGQVLAFIDMTPAWQDVYPVAIMNASMVLLEADPQLPNSRVLVESNSLLLVEVPDGEVAYIRAAITGDVEIEENSNIATIPDETIDYAKIQPVTDDLVLLGNVAGAGSTIQELDAETVRSLLGAGGGGAPLVPFFQDSEIYLTPPTVGGNPITTHASATNRITFVPITVPWTRTYTSIAFSIPTGGAVASSTARLAIYNLDQSDGGPGTVLLDAGTVATDTTGFKQITVSQALDPGQYYLAIWTSAAITIRACTQTSSIAQLAWRLGAATPSPSNYLTRTETYGGAFQDQSSNTQTASSGASSTPLLGIR